MCPQPPGQFLIFFFFYEQMPSIKQSQIIQLLVNVTQTCLNVLKSHPERNEKATVSMDLEDNDVISSITK